MKFCIKCGGCYTLTSNGMIRKHKRFSYKYGTGWREVCEGSGKPPREESQPVQEKDT